MSKSNTQTLINFKTELYKIKDWTILRLPEEASAQLPSRGMTMVKGSFNLRGSLL
jgi:hypothetical protein